MKDKMETAQSKIQNCTKIFIFAGTSEGRELAEILSEKNYDCTVSVATEYGAKILPIKKNLTIVQGRMNSEQMVEAFSQKNYVYVIDATHPFATEVSKEIRKACDCTKIRYLRLARDTKNSSSSEKRSEIFYYNDIFAAADWLESQSEKIFVATGSKNLSVLAEKISNKNRLFVRVLPTVESIKICTDCKIPQNQIIAMQGPFSKETNERQFLESDAKILLTKESGAKGGYFEKIEAAENLGIKIAVIKNPENSTALSENCHYKNERSEIFYSSKDIIAEIETGAKIKKITSLNFREISLIGFGMGSETLLTEEAKFAIENAEIIFSSKRILESAEKITFSAKTEPLYKVDEIFSYLERNSEYKKITVLFSGDVGFFSGAMGFFNKLNSAKKSSMENLGVEWKINVFPGISCAAYFAAKLKKSWQNWKFLSLHGVKCNTIEQIRKNPECFLILSGSEDIQALGKKLKNAIQNEILFSVKCYLGKNFSYSDEKISEISIEEMISFSPDNEKDSLFVLLIENENQQACLFYSVRKNSDDEK